jgi:Transposase DDE domain group 1
MNGTAARASEGLILLSPMKTPRTATPKTDCNHQPLLFQDLGQRHIVADFSGGYLSSDGGALLLRQMDRGLGLTRTLAQAFTDRRDPRYCDHTLQELLAQRLHGLALGYEDLADHDTLRHDPLLAAACDKADPLGRDRLPAADAGVALAGSATLNRLELGNHRQDRTHKITHDPAQVEATLLELGVRCLDQHARELIVDLDAMGHLVHGLQEGRHFSAYYDGYCYLPLYALVGDVPLWAQLRPGASDAAAGVVPALEKIITALRRRCKQARIIVRGDSAFAREEIMTWCEAQPQVVYYCLGLAGNARLREMIPATLAAARARRCLTGAPSARAFADLEYQTLKSWHRQRRVVAKAEVMAAGDNPRFVVTNLPASGFRGQDRQRFCAARLYEEIYCGRGEMENVLKQQTLDLAADRLSTHHLGSNQLRLWLATLAYLLLERLRSVGLRGSALARATVGTIRTRLLKVAASVTVSVRRVWVRLSSAFPLQALYRRCAQRLGCVLAGAT